MKDHELLELAAKAAGVACQWVHEDEAEYSAKTEGMWLTGAYSPDSRKFWNPLTNDGDAFRLAVKLGIDTHPGKGSEAWARAISLTTFADEPLGGTDRGAATRRAITRAAAAIGKAMP